MRTFGTSAMAGMIA